MAGLVSPAITMTGFGRPLGGAFAEILNLQILNPAVKYMSVPLVFEKPAKSHFKNSSVTMLVCSIPHRGIVRKQGRWVC
jgi:hypothetical protein